MPSQDAPQGLDTDGPIQVVTDGVVALDRVIGSLTEDGQMLALSWAVGGIDEADPGTNNFNYTASATFTRIGGTVSTLASIGDSAVNGAGISNAIVIVGDDIVARFAVASVDAYRHTLRVTSRQFFAA